MLRSIEINRLRGIREGVLANLTPLVVFVGQNGTGKSTALEALLIVASPLTTEAVAQAVRRHSGGNREARWLLWKGGEAGTTTITAKADGDYERKCSIELDRAARGLTTNLFVQIENVDPSHGTPSRHFVAVNFPHQQASAPYEGEDFRPFDDIQEARLVEARTYDLQTPLPQLYSKAIRLGRRAEAKEIIKQVVPGAVDIEIATEGDVPVLDIVFDGYSVPASLAGDGVQSVLRICLELATGQGGIVLLEEPEIHQHPGAIWQTARAILTAVRQGVQVILTTHSLELIDALLAAATEDDLTKLSVYGFLLQNGRLITSRLDGPDVAFSRNQIDNDLR